MTENEFLTAINADPGQLKLRLMFADWLEERGDPRAAGFRRIERAVIATEYDGLDAGDGMYFVYGDNEGDGFGDGSYYGDGHGDGGSSEHGHVRSSPTGYGRLANFDGNLGGIDDTRRSSQNARHKHVIGAGAGGRCTLKFLPSAHG